jgi:LysM repeat protein
MRTYVTVALVAALHAGAVGSVMFVQGCRSPGSRSTAGGAVQPAPVTTAPMPPSEASLTARPSPAFKPTYTPPPPVHKPAPAAAATAVGDTYVVQKGDSLGLIAKRYGVSAADLASANSITDPNRVRIGQKLKIPSASSAPSASKPAAAAEPAMAAAGSSGSSTYVVQTGDSLSRVAGRFGVSVAALREANHLTDDRIRVGQKLVIPPASGAASGTTREAPAPAAPTPLQVPPASEAVSVPVAPPLLPAPAAPASASAPAATESGAPADPAGGIVHVVRDGDTMASVAKLYVTKVEDLARANGLSETSSLTPGQRLRIP